MFDLPRDLAFAFRGMRRSPGFALTVILTLGLAIGANATMFGIVDRLLLRPPSHIAAPERVHRVEVARWFGSGLTPPDPSMSYPAFLDLHDRTRTLSDVAAVTTSTVSYGAGREAQRLTAVAATGRYFELLRTGPALGRFFGDAEDAQPAGLSVVVISYGLWKGRFGGDVAIVGHSMMLDGRSWQIIGVAPQGFTGFELQPIDLWLPMTAWLAAGPSGAAAFTQRGMQFLSTYVRLKDGIAPEAAETDVRLAYHEGHATYLKYESKAVAGIAPIVGRSSRGARAAEAQVTVWLFGMAGIVLLIACANIANLVLARGLTRRAEIAVRRALGVSSVRLFRQFTAESLLLASIGCLLGLGVARWGGGAARALLLPDTSWDAGPLSGRVLLFTAGATLLAAVLASLLPLWRGTRTDLAQALHGASRSMVAYPRRMLAALLLVQIGLAMVLLIGSGLFVRSLNRVQSLDLGFAPAELLYVALPGGDASVAAARSLYDAAAARLQRLPVVRNVGYSAGGPFLNNYATSVRAPGVDSFPRLAGGGPYYFRTSAGALEAMGVRITRGRLFTASDDRPGAQPVVVITQGMAQRLWPGADPLTKCLIISDRPCAPVVGVVADMHRQGLREKSFLLFFTPIGADTAATPEALLVRVTGAPERAVEPIRRELLAMRADLPFIRIQSYESLIAPQARSWRLGANVFTAFGLVSLLLAALGVHGVLSYTVTQRTPELGIRAALGATPAHVMRTVLSTGLGTAAVGVAAGCVVALVAASRVQPLLFDTSARDPVVMAVAGVAILAIAVPATLIPGLRAARIDPLRALRAE
jgi:predicted permease